MDQLPDELIPVLIAAAFLEVALIALPRNAAIAWPAVTIAAAIATVEVIGAIRSILPASGGQPSRELETFATVSLLAATGIATGYAARRLRSRTRLSALSGTVVVAGFLATTVTSAFVMATAGRALTVGAISPLTVSVRIGLATMVVGLLVGMGNDLASPIRRARGRTRANPSASLPGVAFVRNLAAEILPGGPLDRRAAEAERARLAADLHALVLPELRRAAAAAQSPGVPLQVQVDLRRALEDVEQLMHERQSVVLEQFGLVAALEWLAERTEERSPLRVELELEGEVPDRPAAIDPTVARAAFRISLLALDNVVRHTRAATATIRLSANASGIRLRIFDDGPPIGQPARAGRGIADMRAAAAASGGSIDIELAQGGRVSASWPSARAAANHAIRAADPADRSEPATR
jgi:signal transduction histidine kinase